MGIPSGLAGIQGWNAGFESVIAGCARLIGALGADMGAEQLRFPPVMNLAVLKRNGYFVGFPHLAGCIHSFAGAEADHKHLLYQLLCDEPAGAHFTETGAVLTPAACYPAYPAVAARGPLPAGGATLDVESYCFRNEPSADPTRLRSFRMREYVRLGAPADVLAFREAWFARAGAFIAQLGLEGWLEIAHDPFFGAGGETLGADQAARSMKFEMLVPINEAAPPTACMSFNYHETHFAAAWNIRQADGALAHTACVGFGMERLALALFARHGAESGAWPAPVRAALGLAA